MRFFRFIPLLFITSIITAQPVKYDTVVNRFIKTQHFNGTVLIADKGKIVYEKASGMANRPDNIPATVSTKYKICSITKTFTTVLILQLMEEGKIDLNKTIGTYFPDYTGEARDKVTIHQLLTYSSGIENIDQTSEAMYVMQQPVDSIIKKYCSGKLVTEPGKQFSYKNADFIILGRVIEKITGKSFRTVLQERIIKPLQLTNTGYLTNGDIIPGLADSYLLKEDKFYNDDIYWIENFYSSAAMYSTVEDLFRFDQSIFNTKIIKKATLDKMLTAYPDLYSVAYGFWVSGVKFGKVTTKVADRQGSIGGSNTTWLHFIDDNKTIIIFSNTDATNLNELRHALGMVLLGQQ